MTTTVESRPTSGNILHRLFGHEKLILNKGQRTDRNANGELIKTLNGRRVVITDDDTEVIISIRPDQLNDRQAFCYENVSIPGGKLKLRNVTKITHVNPNTNRNGYYEPLNDWRWRRLFTFFTGF